MNLLKDFIKQIQFNYISYFVALGIPFVILLFTWNFGKWLGLSDLGDLTRDPNTILKGHVYTGMISNAGIFFWSASATITLFTAVYLYKNNDKKVNILLMLFSGILSFILGFDDVFQMHEKMFNDIRYIPENLFYLTYFICIVFITLICFKAFIQTDFPMWCLALFLFFGSLVIDHDFIKIEEDHAFWEDSFKFAGIVVWSIYYLKTSMMLIMFNSKKSKFV